MRWPGYVARMGANISAYKIMIDKAEMKEAACVN
jgi:hypothetical protein